MGAGAIFAAARTLLDPCVVVIGDAGTVGGSGSIATTGWGGDLTVMIITGIGMLAVGVFVVAYKRYAARESESAPDKASSRAARAATLLVVICAAMLFVPMSSAQAASDAAAASSDVSAQSAGCDLMSVDIDFNQATSGVGSDPDVVQVLTIRNVSNVTIALRMAVPVTSDPMGLGPHVAVSALCDCSSNALLNAPLMSGLGAGQSAALAPGATARITVSMRTMASITNAQQGTSLVYGITVYADQVVA